MHSGRQSQKAVQNYMSQSSLPGEHSSNPSSRPPQTKPTTGSADVQSPYRPVGVPAVLQTTGALHADSPTSPDLPTQSRTRSIGVHSILNPSSDAASYVGSGHAPSASATHPVLPPPIGSPRSRKRSEPSSPTRAQHGATSTSTGRRVLTPRSPAVRGASLGPRRNPTFQAPGTSMQPSIGHEPRIYTAEPGSADIPSLPPISAAPPRTALPGIQATEAWPGQTRPLPGPSVAAPPPGSMATTQTASPSTSHTSQSQTEQPSPAYQYGSMPGYQQPPASYGQQGYSMDPTSRGHPESYPAGQSAYQMTLETDQGPMVVPVELDLQQASKLADEKRKRNAGASARFRARRKEKEKEASQTISSLQQDVRDAREDRDFYRSERNYFRDIAGRLGHQALPRPPSPHLNRLRLPPALQPLNRSPDSIGRARSDSAPAAQRRRTGDYQPQFGTGPIQQSPIAQPFGPGYPPPPIGLPLPPPAQPQGPGPYASPRALPPGPPGPPLPGQRSQSSYDPFRKDPFDRSWNPAR